MSLLASSANAKIKVSSTLNKDVKNFGKQFLTDGSNETCWNSEAGPNQWIIVDFVQPVSLTQVGLMFQGGFSAAQVHVFHTSTSPLPAASPDWIPLTTVYPTDSNAPQSFDLASGLSSECIRSLKVVFADASDTYGRIILYGFDLYGQVVE
ncbi:nuclear receptor 2C2-associated protein-like protein [Chytriomyces sp. MP71]|nr:nuclear receptor 2C2-associated protein-like protein [Chytriomyces sp. MP71]